MCKTSACPTRNTLPPPPTVQNISMLAGAKLQHMGLAGLKSMNSPSSVPELPLLLPQTFTNYGFILPVEDVAGNLRSCAHVQRLLECSYSLR